jgi:hypothetical protein
LTPSFFTAALALSSNPRFLAVDEVEAARELAHELDVRHLILADGHHVGAVDEDVRRLHHRVSQEAVVRQIAVGKLLLGVLVRRDALQPADRRDHAEQSASSACSGTRDWMKDRRAVGVDPGGEPVDEHLPDRLGDRLLAFVVRGKRMPIRGEVQALVLLPAA